MDFYECHHSEKGRITLILHVSEYAVTFCEGILFVTTLEKAECSKVLEISNVGFWGFFVWFFLVCL